MPEYDDATKQLIEGAFNIQSVLHLITSQCKQTDAILNSVYSRSSSLKCFEDG